jgi:glutaconate CoA-transferase subunit B
LTVSPDVQTTPKPTREEVEIIRILDSQKVYTGAGLRNLTWENYLNMLESSCEKLRSMFK